MINWTIIIGHRYGTGCGWMLTDDAKTFPEFLAKSCAHDGRVRLICGLSREHLCSLQTSVLLNFFKTATYLNGKNENNISLYPIG